MADITLSYKGSTIATMSASGSKTIQTKEKYCEGDIGLSYERPITMSYEDPISDLPAENNIYMVLERGVPLAEKPTCKTPEAGIAGQNQELAINALNATGANTENVANWATANNKYNNLWVGADFGSPVALNSVVVGCRTWDGRRQIYTLIFEASNDASTWTELGKSRITGNKFPATGWYLFGTGNTTAYRYYRIRTETSGGDINGSVTFTIYGLGFLNYQTTIPFGTPFTNYFRKDGTRYQLNA